MSRGRPGELSAVRLEMENEWAWCGQRRLELTPRAFAVLRHLVEHGGRLVTKEDLLTTLWRDTIVSDAALASCIRDLRKALGDSSEAPRYIETVHRRGFRFIGPIARPTLAHSGQSSRLPGSDTAIQWSTARCRGSETERRRRSLSPGTRGARAIGQRTWGRAACPYPQATGADLAGAAAGVVDRPRSGGGPAPGADRDARADAPGAGGGPRRPH